MSRACFLVCLSLCLPLPACSMKPDIARPEASWLLNVLGPKQPFIQKESPASWVTQGPFTPERVRLEPSAERDAVRITGGEQGLVLARKLNAYVLTTPFLTWQWKVAPHKGGTHPVRLIVGFRDGGAPRGVRADDKGALPDHDRSLVLLWGHSALNRGWSEPSKRDGAPARYTVRGGQEHTRQWFSEGVDLVALHKRLWPDHPLLDVRVAYAGVAAAGGSSANAAFIRDINLTR